MLVVLLRTLQFEIQPQVHPTFLLRSSSLNSPSYPIGIDVGLLEGEYDRSIFNIPFSMEAEETSKALSSFRCFSKLFPDTFVHPASTFVILFFLTFNGKNIFVNVH